MQQIFDTLLKNKLFSKQSKCIFAQPQVEYLGHIIRGDGVATDLVKIEAVVKWPPPENVALTGYYRRYIQYSGFYLQPLFQP